MPSRSFETSLVVAAMAVSLSLLVGAHAGDEPELVVKTRARLKELQKELEGMREARFESPVAIKAQSQDGCKKAFQAGLEGWMPRERSRVLSRAYGKLGLLPKGYDLFEGLQELYASQVFAYYQPGEATFYVVETGLPGIAVDAIMLHELAHALDDQRFGLTSIYSLAGKDDDDSGLAGQFLIEGTAYYITVLSQAKTRNELEKLDRLAETEGELGRDELEAEYARRLDGYAEGKHLYEEAARRRAKLPLYMWRRYMEPYTKGCLMISRVKREGGWKAVDALWKRPPTSTEQVLHPEKLTASERDEPVSVQPGDVSSELGDGWRRTATNVLGELGMQSVLANRGGADVAAISSGWGGDRLDAYECAKDEQRSVVVWLTTWDTEKAAKSFEEGFPRRDDSVLVRREKDVILVEGAGQDARKVAAAALDGAKTARRR